MLENLRRATAIGRRAFVLRNGVLPGVAAGVAVALLLAVGSAGGDLVVPAWLTVIALGLGPVVGLATGALAWWLFGKWNGNPGRSGGSLPSGSP